MEFFDLVPSLVKVCFYDKRFTQSTHKYSVAKYGQEAKDNLELAAQYHEVDQIYTINQVHGAAIVSIDDLETESFILQADGMYTSGNQIGLGIITADCVPLLITSTNGDIIGAAHCGWRSVAAGIVPQLLQELSLVSDHELIAAIGPSIQQASYEVDKDVYEIFLRRNREFAEFFQQEQNKYMLDLPGCVEFELAQYNVPVALRHEEDTYEQTDRYFSHRRSIHVGEERGGSILSVISCHRR